MTRTDLSPASGGADLTARRHSAGAARWLCPVAVLFLAAALQGLAHLDGDDSWFITFAEKYLDGLKPYVEISDPNPPAAFLVYVPAVLLARCLGVRPEFAVACLTCLGAVSAILIAGRLLRRAGLMAGAGQPAALTLGLYLCLVLPAFCFAEREHIAGLAMLPVAALLAARAQDRAAAPLDAVVAGIGAGLALTFKPYFILPLLFALIGACGRNWRRLPRCAPELGAVCLVLAVYAALIFRVFPDYLAIVPLVLAIYAPVRDLWSHLVLSPLFLANAALLGVILYRACRGRIDPRARICALVSLGFLATFLIQGKGWNNHALPGITFALFALAIELRLFAGAPAPARRHDPVVVAVFLAVLCAAPFLFGGWQVLADSEEHPGLAAAVARLAPPSPKIAALAEQLDFGHPLVRRFDGTWIGRRNCLWIAWGVKYLRRQDRDGAAAARRNGYLDADVAAFAEDVRSGKPDILLIESKALERWARGRPALSGLFDTYVQTASAGAVEIWQPRRR